MFDTDRSHRDCPCYDDKNVDSSDAKDDNHGCGVDPPEEQGEGTGDSLISSWAIFRCFSIRVVRIDNISPFLGPKNPSINKPTNR